MASEPYERLSTQDSPFVMLESRHPHMHMAALALLEATQLPTRRADLDLVTGGVPGARVDRAGDEQALDTDDSDRTEFWRTLVLCLIVIAGLETLLAWRFGHHKRSNLAAEGKQVFVR